MLKNIMKIYKNCNFKFFPIFFALFLFFILSISIVKGIRDSEYENIKYYILVIFPIIFFIILFYKKFYREIIIDESKLYLSKFLLRKKIPLYNILKIEEPYIMTINELLFLYPDDINFWNELKEIHNRYQNKNEHYYKETKEIYNNLISIMNELHKEEIRNKKRGGGGGGAFAIIVYYILLKNLFKYFHKHTLFSNASNLRIELRKNINMSNFA